MSRFGRACGSRAEQPTIDSLEWIITAREFRLFLPVVACLFRANGHCERFSDVGAKASDPGLTVLFDHFTGSFLKMLPLCMTKWTCSRVLMSLSGSPETAITSA